MPALPVTAPSVSCPFNTLEYAPALAHVGPSVVTRDGGAYVLRRPISEGMFDGVGPWPYVWIRSAADIDALRQDFRGLVTITAVTQPGYIPPAAADPVFLKDHFVFDPSLPIPELSARACRRLSDAEAKGTFELARDSRAPAQMAEIYSGVRERRRLHGGLFDVLDDHFDIIARLDCSMFFRVSRDGVVGAMACGVQFGGWLQILHMAMSPDGLQWNAAYLLMRGLQRHASANDVKLLTGGMPDGGTPGLRIFKSRWSNCFLPVHLIRIVNDTDAYAMLSKSRLPTPFFPAYRAPRPIGPGS